MTMLSKGSKPDNYEPHNFLKIFADIYKYLQPSFIFCCESFLESNSPGILALCETNLIDSQLILEIWWRSYLPLIQKDYYSYAWSCSLCERRTSICTGRISRKHCRFLLVFSTSFTSLSVLLLFPISITLFMVMHSFLFYFI